MIFVHHDLHFPLEAGLVDMSVSIFFVVPAYREPDGLKLTLQEIKSVTKKLKKISSKIHKITVVRVDDYSNSEDIITLNIAKQMSDEVLIQKTPGKGIAIIEAIRHIFKNFNMSYENSFLVITDADYTYDLSNLHKMIKIMLANKAVGMIIGLRMYTYGEKKLLILGNKFIRLAHLLFNKVNLRDPLSGLRVIRLSALKEQSLMSRGFDIEVEINCVIKKQGYKILELPTLYRERIGIKKLGLHHAIDIMKRIILLFPKMWFV